MHQRFCIEISLFHYSFLSSDWENPDESDETRNHENEVTQVTDFQQDQPNVEPDGKRPTSEESSGSGTAAKCEASVNASNSITEVKSVTAGSSSAHKDSGFMTISTRQNGRGADDETVIHLEETDNEILNSEECNETVSTGLDNVHKEIKQNEQQQHMSETDFTLSNAVQEMDQPLSNISTFNPPNIKEGIDTLEDSFSRPEISITSDKDED
ncbi:hypothetical protein PoB_003256100 [Plakobranchus ocellatus]|uniref:Uncharacterized protein n=1 Tax=Plakobranchus ocellatus TaxID=259542 RepID=A0AAV4A477_9GAST|nr:hypothetical protein PoB_003256100 [Plakobranchus ocellatus]